MYKSKLQKVQVCKNKNLQKCKSTSYLQSTLRVRTRQSPWQWLSSKVNMLWVKSCLVGFLRHGGEITCKITGRHRRSGVDGKGLEGPCIYTFLGKPRICLSYYLWRLQTARTSYLPFNRLSSKPQQSQKISQNASGQLMSISWNSIKLAKAQQSQKNATRGGSCVHFLE